MKSGTSNNPPKRAKFKLPMKEPPVSTSATAVRRYAPPLYPHNENEESEEGDEEQEEPERKLSGPLDDRPLEKGAAFGVGLPSDVQAMYRRSNSYGPTNSGGPDEPQKKPGFVYEDPIVNNLMARHDRKDIPPSHLAAKNAEPRTLGTRRSFTMGVRPRGSIPSMKNDMIDPADPDANFYQIGSFNHEDDDDEFIDRSPDTRRTDDHEDALNMGSHGPGSYFNTSRVKGLQASSANASPASFSPRSPSLANLPLKQVEGSSETLLADGSATRPVFLKEAFEANGKKPPRGLPTISTTQAPPSPDSDEAKERFEWQNMLSAVIGGEVFKGEKRRIGGEMSYNEQFRREKGEAFWWQIRAKLRGRSEEEERRRVKARRDRTVDIILEEVENFKVVIPQEIIDRDIQAADKEKKIVANAGVSDEIAEQAETEAVEAAMTADQYAMEQILEMLNKLSLAESLYPNQKAIRLERPLYASAAFQARVDAMTAWVSLIRMLQLHLNRLQKWTGSEELDVTKKNTNAERPLIQQRRTGMIDDPKQKKLDKLADDSTFIERILKEESITNTFKKSAVKGLRTLIESARDTITTHWPMFDALGLSPISKAFHGHVLAIIAFPPRLVVEALRVRLRAAQKHQAPDLIAVDDNLLNFRRTLEIALRVKQEHLRLVAPHPSGHWNIPPCLGKDYDEVVTESIKMFFKLLQYKLKTPERNIYFRETDVLEEEWEFLHTVAEVFDGGDVLVTENYYNMTYRLGRRVIDYFETQMNAPVYDPDKPVEGHSHVPQVTNQPQPKAGDEDKRPMNRQEIISWYSKLLDSVKTRYRKIERFARRLNQRFQNSAEYSIENIEIAALLFCLCPDEEEDRHFLVLSDAFMQQGNYIIASPALRDNPELIQRLLFKCLRPREDGTDQEGRELTDAEGKPRSGGVLLDDDVDAKPLAIRDGDGNIATDGGASAVNVEGADGQGDSTVPQLTGETEDVDDPCCYLLIVSPREPFMWPGSALKLDLPSLDLGMQDHRIRLIADGPGKRLEQCRLQFERYFSEKLECINTSQAHLPQIQTDIVRIERSLHRLSESIVASVTRIRAVLNKVGGAQDVIENWFAYGSDQYHRSNNLLDEDHRFRFHRLLMRLAINWIAFVCDFCDPTDRKTFRWAVSALEFAMLMTRGKNILYLEAQEFAVLRSKVATCMALLISHFDILGARGSFEAKKQQEVQEATRKAQRAMENLDDDYGVSSRPTSPSARPQDRINQLLGEVYGATAGDRSIRMIREERVRQIAEVDFNRNSLFEENRVIGQVLDEEVSEDRSLLFLASSTSNIAIKWQQGEFIGAGANGSVFKGFNLETGGIMAVKEIRVADLANTPALYKQIKDESDVMQLLSHPNVVDYYGIEVHRDRVYIFQEYCEGGSLANLISYGRIEDEEVVMLYTYQMLDGLRYLHSKGVEHRDVKPDNILLGANGMIKFVDFGASKAISEEKRNATMNKSRRAVGARSMRTTMTRNKNQEPSLLAGTPMYMAPEVIKGDKSSRSRLGCMDIWSLGCVVLELVTGRKPWSNLDNEWAIMFHIGIATQHPPLPDKSEMSELGISFIAECLTLSADMRPSAAELMTHSWILPMNEQLNEHRYGSGTQSLSTNTSSWDHGNQYQYEAQDESNQPEQYETAQGASVEHAAAGQDSDHPYLNAEADAANEHTLFDDTPSLTFYLLIFNEGFKYCIPAYAMQAFTMVSPRQFARPGIASGI
ncbi:hypothetical protein QFC22_003282 [Naganishia vaughanmartiniae]|uniref:Uncharacterized protein n=1 Tax=Naganishia vaughanmartiniae TaxID=1424756 RepID=A0ACC2X6C8_9TREE|nr:hypothetical protein QFC22_003282 [Naganishia vaughanmartiniae]